MPGRLCITQPEVHPATPIYRLPDAEFPPDWQNPGLIANQQLGDQWLNAMEFVAIKVSSNINPSTFNYLPNPLLPRFHDII